VYGSLWSKLERAIVIWTGFGMTLQGVRTCGDYMFSGHTCVVTLLNFFVTECQCRFSSFYFFIPRQILIFILAWCTSWLLVNIYRRKLSGINVWELYSSLIVGRARLSTVEDWAFRVVAARTWNSLPQHVTSAPLLPVFWSRLKTHLFTISHPSPWPCTVLAQWHLSFRTL